MGAPAINPNLDKKWYLHLNGQNQGPFSMDDLRSKVKEGTLTAATPIWSEGMPGWDKAQNVPQAQGLFSGSGSFSRPGAHESNELSALIHMGGAVTDDSTTNIDAGQLKKAKKEAAKIERKAEKAAMSHAALVVAKTGEGKLAGRLKWVMILVPVLGLGALGGAFALKWITVESIKGSVMGVLDRALASIPPLEHISNADFKRLNEAASTPFQGNGPRIAIAPATDSPDKPTFHVASNLPDGTGLSLLVLGQPGKVLTDRLIQVRMPLTLAKKVARSKAVSLDGKPLPSGDYDVFVFEDEEQTPAIKQLLTPLPASAHPLTRTPYAQGRKLVFGEKFFLGGERNPDFGKKLAEARSEARAKASQELTAITNSIGKLKLELTSTWQRQSTVNAVPKAKRGRAWGDFSKDWMKNFQEPADKGIYYADLVRESVAASRQLKQLHELQTSYFAGRSEVLPQLQDLAGKLQQKVNDLTARTGQASTALQNPAFVPVPSAH